MSDTHSSTLADTLFAERGIGEGEQEEFLHPDYEKLHDSLLLPGMERARDRVIEAMRKDEHIVVFSDYDADGIPGAVVLSDFFGRAGYENVSFYIPHRHDEGFGLNVGAIEECKERDAALIITVDCGIGGVVEVERANELGIDVVITDHHEPGETLPDAYAIVDPKLEGSKYPWKELCGAALAYKLVQAILAKESFGTKPGHEKWSLDMVGIATLSDMVPLLGENRILAKYGLEVLRKSPRPGLAALMRRLRMDQRHITEDDVAFMITPRINAASRMGVPKDAFDLLSTRNETEAEKLAAHLERINNERKGVVASTVKDAKAHLSKRESINPVIVVGNPEWKPALLGLVANSLVEEYKRPAFVWGRDGDGMLKGSCRSWNGCNLHSLMSSVPTAFLEFGGHAGAGGFSLTLEQVTVLEERLSSTLTRSESSPLEEESERRRITLELRDVGEGLWKTVSSFAPFGMANEKPVFEMTCEVKGVKKFGKEGNHLEISLTDGEKMLKAVSFFRTPESYEVEIRPGKKIKVLANLEKSFFMNRPELRLRIVDIFEHRNN